MKTKLECVLRFWHRGPGHVLAKMADGRWKEFTFVREARAWAEKRGYGGLAIRVEGE